MADITVTMTVLEAQQAEQALADRINTLHHSAVAAGTFEAGCVSDGLEYTSRAYARLQSALYPFTEAETVALWEQSKEAMDALIAHDIASDPSVAWHYDLDR